MTPPFREGLPIGTAFGGGQSLTHSTGQPGAFTEGFWYNDHGQEILHVSFQGVVTERLYDDIGRLQQKLHVSFEGVVMTFAATIGWTVRDRIPRRIRYGL